MGTDTATRAVKKKGRPSFKSTKREKEMVTAAYNLGYFDGQADKKKALELAELAEPGR